MKKWIFIWLVFFLIIVSGTQWGKAGSHRSEPVDRPRVEDAKKKNFADTVELKEEMKTVAQDEDETAFENWTLRGWPRPKMFYKEGYHRNDGFIALCGNMTRDGGFIFSGNMTMRVSSDGEIKWQNNVWGTSIQETRDRGFIVCGDSHITKLDPNGGIQWQRKYRAKNGDVPCVNSVRQTKDGRFIAFANSARVFKLTASGGIVWQYTYLTNAKGPFQHGSQNISSIMPTADGGCIIAGSAESSIEKSMDWEVFESGYTWILKISADGRYEWDRTYVGNKYRFNTPQVVQQTRDGCYIVLASMDMGRDYTFGSRDLWVFKLFPNGKIDWQKLFRVDLDLAGDSVRQMSDGGYIIAATESEGVRSDSGQLAWAQPLSAVLLKLDAGGNLEWQRCYGYQDQTPITCGSYSIKQRSDNTYLFAGMADYIFGQGPLIMKLNSRGLNRAVPELASIPKVHSVSDVSFLLLQRGFSIQRSEIIATPSDFKPNKTNAHGNVLFSPPLHLTGELVKDSPLSKTGYLVNLKWEPNPKNRDMKIIKYRILGNVHAEVDADTFEYTHLDINRFWLNYWVTAVTKNGDESLPAFVDLN